jgi:hypothetical protein
VGFANLENVLYLVDYAEDRGCCAASTARRARRSWRTFRFRSDSLVDAGPLFTRETAQLMGNLSRARLLRSYPFRDPDHLVVMSETEQANVRSERTVIPGNCRHFLRLKQRVPRRRRARNEAGHQVSETLRDWKGSPVQTLDCQVNAFLNPWKIIRSPCTQNNR